MEEQKQKTPRQKRPSGDFNLKGRRETAREINAAPPRHQPGNKHVWRSMWRAQVRRRLEKESVCFSQKHRHEKKTKKNAHSPV